MDAETRAAHAAHARHVATGEVRGVDLSAGPDLTAEITVRAESQWIPGIPPHPWNTEWFFAKLDDGAILALKPLPKEFTYDYTTADGTYLMERRIAKWMQTPDSEFVAFRDPALEPVPAPMVAKACDLCAHCFADNRLEAAWDACDKDWWFGQWRDGHTTDDCGGKDWAPKRLVDPAPTVDAGPVPVERILDPDYARIYTQARIVAWQYGWALLAHGSKSRDLDLLLVPWEVRAFDPDFIVLRIADVAGLTIQGPPSEKPHGRKSWSLMLPGFSEVRWVDLSAMTALAKLEPNP